MRIKAAENGGVREMNISPTKRDVKLFRRLARGSMYHIKVKNIGRFYDLGWLAIGPPLRGIGFYQSGDVIITDAGKNILECGK